jgi:hypothetical protein
MFYNTLYFDGDLSLDQKQKSEIEADYQNKFKIRGW